MFIGHFGVGFAAKKWAPGLSLGVLFIAAQFIDLLWPNLLLLGIEEVAIAPGITEMTPLDFVHYPVSHSLLWVATWGILLGLIVGLITRKTASAVVVCLAVISHWFLDLLVHRPDLPLTPIGTERFGFGLWNEPLIAVFIELLIFALGVLLYVRVTRARNKKGRLALLVLILFFLAVYAANILGPPPPDTEVLMWSAQLQWLFVLIAFYVDRHRELKR